jgi:hypothetical protein
MDKEELLQLTMTAIGCALGGDAEGASSALVEIGQRGTHFDVYGACCAFAGVGKAALVKFYGKNAADLSKGDMWAMQEIVPGAASPAELFAMRFLIAYCNDDKEMAPALFRAALESEGDQYVESVCALLVSVAQLSRTALDQPARE